MVPPSSSPGSLRSLSVDGREVPPPPPPPPPVAVKEAPVGARAGPRRPLWPQEEAEPAAGAQPGGSRGPGSRPSSPPVAAPLVMTLRLGFTSGTGGTTGAWVSRPERWFEEPDAAGVRLLQVVREPPASALAWRLSSCSSVWTFAL